mmetsp:Transcript_34858/g.79503  ORF Transcript_34858/g.79503 Transcript_34858/m.79503 type:complete len:268 (-) Transcript_34858:18-821(-)
MDVAVCVGVQAHGALPNAPRAVVARVELSGVLAPVSGLGSVNNEARVLRRSFGHGRLGGHHLGRFCNHVHVPCRTRGAVEVLHCKDVASLKVRDLVDCLERDSSSLGLGNDLIIIPGCGRAGCTQPLPHEIPTPVVSVSEHKGNEVRAANESFAVWPVPNNQATSSVIVVILLGDEQIVQQALRVRKMLDDVSFRDVVINIVLRIVSIFVVVILGVDRVVGLIILVGGVQELGINILLDITHTEGFDVGIPKARFGTGQGEHHAQEK